MIYDVPSEARQRILQVPRIGPDRKTPMFDLLELEDAYRTSLREKHEELVRVKMHERQEMVKQAATSASYRRMLTALCTKDATFWCDHFVKTVDDRLDDPVIPFVLYPRQRELLTFLTGDFETSKGRQNVFVEKSRATGYSWEVMAAYPTWAWLFRNGDTTLLGAVLLDQIDDGGQAATMDSHMGRIRFILRWLPEWMVPEGIEKDSYNKKLILQNPQRPGNFITGRQISPNLGRMSRKRRALLDETAHAEPGDLDGAMKSISQVTNKIVQGTTPKGLGTDSARYRFSPLKKTIFLIHWTTNPLLNVDWYWNERATSGPDTCASELDVSYISSAVNRVFRDFDPLVNVADVDYDPSLPLHLAIDPGKSDPMALLWIQPDRETKLYHIVDAALFPQKSGAWAVPLMLGYIPQQTLHNTPWPYDYDAAAREMIERHGKWRPVDEVYGGADGKALTQVADYSLFDLLFSYGVGRSFGGIIAVKHDDKLEAVDRAIFAMPRVRIARRLESYKSSVCVESVVDCFQQYSWVDTDSPTGRPMKKSPKHDEFCHTCDAFQIWLAGKAEDVVDPSAQPVSPEFRHAMASMPDATGRSGTYTPDYASEGGGW